MPAHKRSSSEARLDEDPIQNHLAKLPRQEPELEEEEEEQDAVPEDHEEHPRQQEVEEAKDEDSESSGSSSTSPSSDEKPEFISVELPEIRKDVQCPICLGIIKKTRTVMECLHRFCRECIDKSMRMGNNECPACRTHCASRRSLRDDPNYDALIAALYPDIDKYEEQELAFHEEERNRNKQIQAAIAQISQRQAEALARRRALGKDAAGAFMTRSQRNNQNARSRRRRNSRGAELQKYEDNEDENDNNVGKDSSSTDEQYTELSQQRCNKRRSRTRPPQSSSSAVNSDGGCLENDLDVSRESRGVSPGMLRSPELLVWGRGGARSHTRHGISSGSNNKNSQNNRLSKLVGYLRSLDENNGEV